YIAIILSGFQYAGDAVGLAPEDIADWLIHGGLDPYTESAKSAPWLVGTVMVVLAVLVGWITGILINLNKYYGFQLWLEGDKLHKRHGLLTVSEGTIPLKKVQSLILRTNPLMRRFGWYRLELQTMGYDVEKQGYQVAAPFAKKSDILRLAPHIRSFSPPQTFTPVSRLTIRRAFIRYSVVLLVGLLPLSYFWPQALWGLLVLPLLLYLAVLRYRNHGYTLSDDILYIKRGVIQHYLWVVPLDKFQVFYTSSSFFQRRLGLRSLVVDTAGAGSFHYPKIVDVVSETADPFMLHLYQRFQAHFAWPKMHSQVEESPTRNLARERGDDPGSIATDTDSSSHRDGGNARR
ncbi:MAG: PH domain-containing protein, partial [Rhodothermales bacterium]